MITLQEMTVFNSLYGLVWTVLFQIENKVLFQKQEKQVINPEEEQTPEKEVISQKTIPPLLSLSHHLS